MQISISFAEQPSSNSVNFYFNTDTIGVDVNAGDDGVLDIDDVQALVLALNKWLDTQPKKR